MQLRVKDLTKVYSASNGEEVRALQDLNLELAGGGFYAVVGPSGSGKTTLFNILGCIDTPTRGSVRFDDEEVSLLPEHRRIHVRRRLIGYIFQAFNLVPTLTAFENASLPFWSEPVAIRRQRQAALLEVFEGLGIGPLAKRYPKELSGGQEQRVAIARALANNPKLVLADEPTGNLDGATTVQIMELLRSQNRRFGTTFLVATHDPSLLQHFDAVISLRAGWLEAVRHQGA